MQMPIFLSEKIGGNTLELLDDGRRTVGWPRLQEQMDMIRLDSQFQNLPSVLGTLILDQFSTVVRHVANQNRFASLGGPDQMVDHQMNSMLVSLVFHTGIIHRTDRRIDIVYG